MKGETIMSNVESLNGAKGITVLKQKRNWYNSFFVNGIELENIRFYNSADGIIFQTGKGWFDCINRGDNRFDNITLLGECHNRRKVNLSKNEIFLCGKELYIPMEYIKDFKCEEMTEEIGTQIYISDKVSFVIDNNKIIIKTNYRFKRNRKGELYKKFIDFLKENHFNCGFSDYDLDEFFKYYKNNREELEELFKLV